MKYFEEYFGVGFVFAFNRNAFYHQMFVLMSFLIIGFHKNNAFVLFGEKLRDLMLSFIDFL